MSAWYDNPIFKQMLELADSLDIRDTNGQLQYLINEELFKQRKLPMDMTARELIHVVETARSKWQAQMDEIAASRGSFTSCATNLELL